MTRKTLTGSTRRDLGSAYSALTFSADDMVEVDCARGCGEWTMVPRSHRFGRHLCPDRQCRRSTP